MALPTFTTRQTALSDDMTSIVSHLQGGSGKTDAWSFRVSGGNNYLITLADAAGVSKVSIRDSAEVEVFKVDSDGNVTIAGTITFSSAFVFPTSASPSQTTEGAAVWDTDDDVLTVGTGAGRKTFGYLGATAALVGGTAASGSSNETSRVDHVHPGPFWKYKTATQTFSATSAFADVTASSGNMAFSIAANETWLVDYWLPITYTGTGGLKFQLTGPAAPTTVHLSGTFTANVADAPDSNPSWNQRPFSPATAFSAAVISVNAAAGYGADIINANQPSLIHMRALIVNGANAGTVTLQGAQNSANGTTVLGIGCNMRAEKIA